MLVEVKYIKLIQINELPSWHGICNRQSVTQLITDDMLEPGIIRTAEGQDMFMLNPRAPLYMGMITLSTALAAVTHLGIGLLTFVWMTLLYESITHLFGRSSNER